MASNSYLIGLKSVSFAKNAGNFMKKIILLQVRFNPIEVRLNIEKLRKLEFEFYESFDVLFNLK